MAHRTEAGARVVDANINSTNEITNGANSITEKRGYCKK